jgi:hypothetical protein
VAAGGTSGPVGPDPAVAAVVVPTRWASVGGAERCAVKTVAWKLHRGSSHQFLDLDVDEDDHDGAQVDDIRILATDPA